MPASLAPQPSAVPARWRGRALTLLAGLCAGLLVALGSAIAAPKTSAQPPAPVSVVTAFDRGHATVGDPIGLTVTIHHPASVSIDTSGIVGQFGAFSVLAASPPVDQAAPDGARLLLLHYQVAVYQTGALQLPAIHVAYRLNGRETTAQSQPLAFTIDSVIPPGDPATNIRALKPQIDLPVPSTASARPFILAGAGVVVLLLLAFAIRRTAHILARRPRPLTPAPPLPSLEEEARAELDRIVADGLLRTGDYATHYARLAACIRTYIARRYGFPAFALTTAELNERMVRSGIGRWRARLVSGLLEECDAAHFAHYQPAPARAEADVQMAYEIVDLTWTQETRPEESRMEVGQRE